MFAMSFGDRVLSGKREHKAKQPTPSQASPLMVPAPTSAPSPFDDDDTPSPSPSTQSYPSPRNLDSNLALESLRMAAMSIVDGEPTATTPSSHHTPPVSNGQNPRYNPFEDDGDAPMTSSTIASTPDPTSASQPSFPRAKTRDSPFDTAQQEASPPLPKEPSNNPFAKYKRVRFLNEGSFGTVELAVNVETNERVAVKYIPRGNPITRYVQREILNHRLCSRHPHIISFKEVFVTATHLGIVMEYAAGGDLFGYVAQKKRLGETTARWFFQQLIIGMDFCHRRGIVNRDVKLENLLLDSGVDYPVMKICDFGYAKNDNVDSIPNSVVGTPEYIAPEILNDVNYDAHKSDVWSCGVILFVMLMGKYPFQEAGDEQLGDQRRMQAMVPRMLSRRFKVLPSLSAPCKDLIARLLEPDPLRRITVEDMYTHPWFVQDLPGGAVKMNDKVLLKEPRTPQTEAQIVEVVEAARVPPHKGGSVNRWVDEEVSRLAG